MVFSPIVDFSLIIYILLIILLFVLKPKLLNLRNNLSIVLLAYLIIVIAILSYYISLFRYL
jgi:hypothetical protein